MPDVSSIYNLSSGGGEGGRGVLGSLKSKLFDLKVH